MGEDFILAHDVGTSGTKSSLVSREGEIVASHATAHPTHTPRAGWAEQNPEDWWAGVCRNTRAILDERPELRSRVACIGVSGHMLGCVAVDAAGSALAPALLHSDTRAVTECDIIRNQIGAETIYRTTGNILGPQSSLAKILWLKHHAPDVYARAHRFVQSKDYIVGRMVGEYDSTDFSDASHAQWLDIGRRKYATDILSELGVDVNKLPALHAGVEIVGKLTDAAADALGLPSGIPAAAGGGDGACATVGAGAVNLGDTYCCIGTTAWISATLDEPILDAAQRIFNIVSVDGRRCGVYGTIQCAGRSLDWILEVLGEEVDRLDSFLSATPRGSEGLLFLPYLEGERSPIFDADARGVFFGLTPRCQRAHFVRATVEGVCFALRSVLEVLRESLDIRALRLIGGGAQSEAWRQMLADVCHVKVQTLSTQAPDATSLGAAVAAGVGAGMFENIAHAANVVQITSEQEASDADAAVYDRMFRVYSGLYPALKPLYLLLKESIAE